MEAAEVVAQLIKGDTKEKGRARDKQRLNDKEAERVLNNGCAYRAIVASSGKTGKGGKVLSAANIGKILRRIGYPHWVDGSPLTPDLIMQVYMYNVPRVKGSDMPVALNNSCFILDIHDGVIEKYRGTEVQRYIPAPTVNQTTTSTQGSS